MKLKNKNAPVPNEKDGQPVYDVLKQTSSRRELTDTRTPENKKLLNPAKHRSNPKTFFCCSQCSLLGIDIKKHGNEIVNYQILHEELKSTQKSIARCKEDTNKILDKVERLERFFQ